MILMSDTVTREETDYRLDQGRNAYTNTGDALLDDPKVIELYLGTLAQAN